MVILQPYGVTDPPQVLTLGKASVFILRFIDCSRAQARLITGLALHSGYKGPWVSHWGSISCKSRSEAVSRSNKQMQCFQLRNESGGITTERCETDTAR